MREQGKEFPTPSASVGPCPVCGDSSTAEFKEFRAFKRVTSDCRTWPAGGRLAACGACGLVFKPFDADFRRESSEIYSSYQIYHQSGGREQRVRDPRSGSLLPRSAVLVSSLLDTESLPNLGAVLDVGCGNGAFLSAFAKARPEWRLYGTEHDDTHADILARLPGFAVLITGSETAIDALISSGQRFDLISLIHVLEHLQDPVTFLKKLAPLLTERGVLFVECPDVEANPFDLLTADHAFHFSNRTLAGTLARAGFTSKIRSSAWIAKELSAVGRPGYSANAGSATSDTLDLAATTQRHLSWLARLAEQARLISSAVPIGCFGTSIAGTWLTEELGVHLGFFVDEDKDRAGTQYLGRPVLKPSEVHIGSTVLVALAPAVASKLADRMRNQSPSIQWITPEPA
jgi:2-polyprenyl-3-methyl-5-hydroxy-6-metoxy-1,4-benzoquinol methylase